MSARPDSGSTDGRAGAYVGDAYSGDGVAGDGVSGAGISGEAGISDIQDQDTELIMDSDPSVERRLLLDLLIYAWDRARSAGVWERLSVGLAGVGVEVVRPDGEVFDPIAHEAGGVEPTSDPLLHNTVAETESVGFLDRGRVIREPVVVVYRLI
jgi:molecular chaperone GrpE